MHMQVELSESMSLMDLGDATLETKQQSPVPPYYQDSTFGFGYRPG
jgi:hypothetical protein